MGVVQIVFSPTGGTKKVADVITSEWGQPVRTVDLSDAEADFDSVSLEKGDVAVIAVPSFGGRVPAPAAERLKKIHGNQAFAVLVCVYGNRAYEDTLVELSDAAQESGFQVAAGIAAIAEHSIMHQYAAGRPDENDQKELREFAAKIWKKIEEKQGGDGCAQSSGKSSLQKSGRRRHGAEGRQKLHRLRPLRQHLPRSGDQQRGSHRYGQQQMYFLYALRGPVSSESPET